jgi:hypothetical protein
VVISVALSREEGRTSVGVTVLETGGGVAVAEELVATVTGAVEAKRMLAALQINGDVFDKEFLAYTPDRDALFPERSGLDRIRAFCTREERYRSQQWTRLLGIRIAHV